MSSKTSLATAGVDIAYIVSHGFAARMVMQTNLLGKLVETGKTVALIAPDAEDENLRTYCRTTGVSLYEFKPTANRWNDQYAFARKYFLEDIKANPALWEKHIYATRYNKAKNPWRLVRPWFLYAGYRMTQAFPAIRKWYQRKEDQLLESNEATRLIELIAPKALVATYPVNFLEGMLLKAAKAQGCKTVIHLLSWDNISCKGHFPQLADEYIAWGPIMAAELKEYYGVSDEKIHQCGVPHFDVHLLNRANPQPGVFLEKLGLKADRPYLFFGMSSPRFAPSEIDSVEWLGKQVTNNVFGKDMQLIVRPHPQNVQGNMADTSWLPRLEALNSDRIGVDFPDLSISKMAWSMQEKDMLRMSRLLAGCTVSLNSGSTLSIDALMCGKPVILTSFDAGEELTYWRSARRLIDYTHLRKLVDCQGVSVVKNYKDLIDSLLKYLNDPNYLINERNYTASQECKNASDGFATERCVEIVKSLVETL